MDTPTLVDQPTPPPRRLKNYDTRVVIVEDFYHIRPVGNPLHLRPGYRRFLKTNDQAYGPRELVATGVWQRIDCGWIQKCSALLLVNSLKAEHLTDEEYEHGTLEVLTCREHPAPSGNYDPWLLPPEESLRGQPSNLRSLWVRCRGAVAEVPYTVTVIPE